MTPSDDETYKEGLRRLFLESYVRLFLGMAFAVCYCFGGVGLLTIALGPDTLTTGVVGQPTRQVVIDLLLIVVPTALFATPFMRQRGRTNREVERMYHERVVSQSPGR